MVAASRAPIGVASTLAAGLVANLGTLFDMTQVILGVFAGPLLACVAPSVSRLRCGGAAMSTGLVLGAAAGVAVRLYTPIAVLWIAPIAAATTALMAVGLTLLPGGRPAPDRPVAVSSASAIDD